ncbi:MAG TPA: hypothetical protein VJ385_20410 [Fibrobacteria bacterium]|nr:hypothetical protein [Fibrobacteria bacterium]
MKTNIFKFLALRAPDTTARDARAVEAIRDERPFEGTVVGVLLEPKTPPKTEGMVLKEVRELVAGAKFALDGTEPLLQKLEGLFARHRTAFDASGFQEGLRSVLGATPADFTAGKEFLRLFAQCWDKLHAFYVLKRVEPLNLEGLMRDLRVLNLLKALASGRAAPSAEVLNAYAAYPVVIPRRLAAFAPVKGGKPAAPKPADNVLQGYRALWREFGDLYKARKELATVRWEQKTVTAPAKTAAVKAGKGAGAGKTSILAQTFHLAASAKELARLSPGTRAWLAKTRVSEGAVSLAVASDKLNAELTSLQSRILSIRDPFFSGLLPRTEDWSVFFASHADTVLNPGLLYLDMAPLRPPDVFSPPLAAVKPLGVGDLKVVKQTFEKYTAGEIAHIENVLKGEYKERKHRQLNRSEDVTAEEQETIEESERDTQKTDRFELKKESESAIETDMNVQAGLTVSVSYGPVSIGARAEFGYSTSSRETNRTSSNFAQEVISRAVDKIQKKAREERVRKMLQETEETNLHGIDNKLGTGNVSGIYRFVDKHYKAQIFNYGRRMMFEFIVPEPAAFLRYSRGAAAAAPNADFPPLVPLGAVTHRDIQEWNYHEYIQRYAVQGVTPPPPQYTTVAVALAAGDIPIGVARADSNKEVNVPAGYTAKYWTGGRAACAWISDQTDLILIVGNGNGDGSLSDEDAGVPIGIHLVNIAAYAITVEVHCERTARHFEEWQIKTYEKILAAYRGKVAEKENRAAAAKPMGVVISGQNPRANREVEKAELKKNCVTIMTNQYFGTFNAMSGVPPEINVPESFEEGKYIQFFEQAFEWEQLTYLFYPYFWGRKTQWPAMMNGADPDPLFDQFLKAGAARVLVPVHPLYSEAVLYYLETGRVWNGGESPRIGDPLYLALYEEVRDQQDDLEGAVPEGEPWNVVVPTSLVYLQSDFSLRTTNDDLNPPET